jgi:cupin 2 domain-containing protein
MNLPEVRNLLKQSGPQDGVETFEELLSGGFFRLEHIQSRGEASPADFWYDQPGEEWVLLARGEARLDFGRSGTIQLRAGDFLRIPAHCRHRVDAVSRDAIWLALHFSASVAD